MLKPPASLFLRNYFYPVLVLILNSLYEMRNDDICVVKSYNNSALRFQLIIIAPIFIIICQTIRVITLNNFLSFICFHLYSLLLYLKYLSFLQKRKAFNVHNIYYIYVCIMKKYRCNIVNNS